MAEFRPVHATNTGGDTDGLAEYSNTDGLLLPNYNEKVQAVTSSSGVLAIDVLSGNVVTTTLTENITDIDFTNVPAAGSCAITWIVTQDASSAYTVAINAVTINGGGDVTALTAAAAGFTMTATLSKTDVVSILFVNAGTPYLNAVQEF
jgi:hypothetical protein